ncbi:TIGR04086 family membrane protein [Aquihabitans sp. McL0605]|uniref:TIGR04086 family membrane protein n=1 Tax=Aquihabitans sp. McL0605 TaxID=3415671 RepID=UPI003CF1320F
MERSNSATRDHREAAAEAGLGGVSPVSVLAGLVTAYGTFAVVAAIAGSVLASADVNTEFRTNDWTGSGAVASVTAAAVLLVAYLFGGYVAGRMARRRGALHGVLLFVATLIVGAVAGGIVAALTDDAAIRSNLRSIGVPTTTDQITGVAVAGVILSLAAILLGSVLGGVLGERWHTRFAARLADPEVGTSADERRRVQAEAEARRDRIYSDPSIAPRGDAVDADAHADGRDRERHIDLTDAEAADAAPDQERRYTEAEWRRIDGRINS